MKSPQTIAKRYIDMLPKGKNGEELPMPRFAVVNGLTYKWNGIAIHEDGITTIKYQKRIATDERTLNRIIAHEICHAWAYWKAWTLREYPEGHGRGHKPISCWAIAAAIINRQEGSDFVTERSDETYVETNEKSFWVYLEYGATGIWWAWFSRVTDSLSDNLMRRIAQTDLKGGRCTLVKTNDSRFILPNAKLPSVARLQQMPEDLSKKIHAAIDDNPITPEVPRNMGVLMRRSKKIAKYRYQK
jgi:hypothetical protein